VLFFPRIIIFGLAVLLSQPMLTTIDRGNVQGLMIGLLFSAYHCFIQGKRKLAFVFFILACSIKGYPILLILFMHREKIAVKMKIVIAFLGLNFASIFLLAVSPLAFVRGYFIGITENQASCPSCGYSFSTVTTKLVYFVNPEFPMERIGLVNSFISLILLSLLLLTSRIFKDINSWEYVFLSFSFLQLIPGLANNFTLTWIFLPLVIYLKQQGNSSVRLNGLKDFMFVACLVASLGPNIVFIQSEHFATWLMTILSPLFILITVAHISFLEIRKSRKFLPK
jgi:hypothetical protein